MRPVAQAVEQAEMPLMTAQTVEPAATAVTMLVPALEEELLPQEAAPRRLTAVTRLLPTILVLHPRAMNSNPRQPQATRAHLPQVTRLLQLRRPLATVPRPRHSPRRSLLPQAATTITRLRPTKVHPANQRRAVSPNPPHPKPNHPPLPPNRVAVPVVTQPHRACPRLRFHPPRQPPAAAAAAASFLPKALLIRLQTLIQVPLRVVSSVAL